MFDHVRKIGQGFRTLIGAGALMAVGIADTLGTIDISPLVGLFVSDQRKLGAIIVALTLFFGMLRFMTKTSMFEREPEVQDQYAPDKCVGSSAGH
jgi:hypothetical protein